MNNSIFIRHSWSAVFIFTLLLTLLSSCIKDELIPTPSVEDDSNMASITFALRVPKSETPSAETRSTSNELEINDITVIAFKEGKYFYKATPTVILGNNLFRVNLVKGGPYELLFVANYKDKLPHFAKDESQEAVIEKLKISLDAASPKWILDGGDENMLIPMASDVIPVWEINETTHFTGSEGIFLYRSLAKVDIEIRDWYFELTSVHVFNYNLDGNLIPKFDGFNIIENVPKPQYKEIGPIDYVAESRYECRNMIYLLEVLNNNYAGDVVVPHNEEDRTAIVIGGKLHGDDEIYYYRIDFCAENGGELVHFDLLRNHRYVICINEIAFIGENTVELAFKAGPANIKSEVVVWDESEIKYVKTNGRYSIGIESENITVLGRKSEQNKMLVMSDCVDKIIVSSSLSEIDPDAPDCHWITNVRLVETGVKNSMISYDLYYDLEENPGDYRIGYIHLVENDIEVVIEVVQEPLPLISFLVKDAQGNWVEAGDTLRFVQKSRFLNPEAKRLRIEWRESSDIEIDYTFLSGFPGFKKIAWTPENDIVSSGSNFVEFNVQLSKLESYEHGSFAEGSGKYTIDFKLNAENNNKDIIFQQIVQDIFVVPNRLILDGNQDFITIKSNVPWKLYVNKNISRSYGTPNHIVVEKLHDKLLPTISESGDIDSNAKTIISNGQPNIEGLNVSVITYNDFVINSEPHVLSGELGLYVESIESPTELNESVIIPCAGAVSHLGREANCYVLNSEDSDIGILIPVRAANGVFDQSKVLEQGYKPNLSHGGYSPQIQIPSDMKYGVKLVWTDVPTKETKNDNGELVGLGRDGLIEIVSRVGTGSEGFLLVIPGDRAKEGGNAVVAVTHPTEKDAKGEPKILWSWHVWVTDEMRYTDKLMTGIIQGGHNGTGFGSVYSESEGEFVRDEYLLGAEWLDRNIGALTNTIAQPTTLGLHYQWGRKDPFPGSRIINPTSQSNNNEYQLYDSKGEIPMKPESTTGSVTHSETDITSIATSIQYPLIFDMDWQTSEGIAGPNVNVWGIGNETKTIFDPCPAGWRVPNKDDFGSIGIEDKNWVNIKDWVNTRGRYYKGNVYKGGYYPAAGMRHSLSGNSSLMRVGDYITHWVRESLSVGPNSKTSSFNLTITSNYVSLPGSQNRSNYRSSGYSVRCVIDR